MAYEPNEWSCGDTVTAEKLNAMERGISDMNADYVPTEWVCGDVITAEKLNHMEQGIANGCEGGGSSDFSTATVTIINSALTSGDIFVVYIDPIDEYLTTAKMIFNNEEIINLQAVLYKGVQLAAIEVEQGSVSVSGNITYNDGELLITGDCTITIS